ncbi:MAG: dual specificity protein phosphatase family protein [Pirellulales bacterium]|nr:dual specificity protein phosphatase family protein [Pirellulales bacterium]
MHGNYLCRTVTLVLLAGLLLPAVARTDGLQQRPDAWAKKLDRPGLPNLHKVDDGLYRGAQPTAEGIKELEKLGVKTIVILREKHSDKEIIGKSNIAYVSIALHTWSVDEKDVARFLRIATDKNLRPVFVHCQHGADRTGAMCAAYRVAVDGWTKRRAIDEMTGGGFGFHSIWKNLPKLIENLDVEKVKTDAGLKAD